jgi:hypothetical protein
MVREIYCSHTKPIGQVELFLRIENPKRSGGSHGASWEEIIKKVLLVCSPLSYIVLLIRLLCLGWSCTLGDILATQIVICNELARRRQALFATSSRASLSGDLYSRDDRRWDEYLKIEKRKVADVESLSTNTIGCACDDIQVGDSVVLIAGVRVPLILRRDGASWRLISPANVLRMMEGKDWHQDWQEDDLVEIILS